MNLTFQLDATASMPLYEQIYLQLRREITDGFLVENMRLPSKRRLATDLKVSLITVESAYEQLIAEGYIRAVPRSGYFVNQLSIQPLTGRKMEQSSESTRMLPSDSVIKLLPESSVNPLVAQRKRNEDRMESDPAATSVRLDLSTNRVDTENFPFATWARLSRSLIQEKNRELLGAVHPQGLPELRTCIARHLHAYRGIHCHPDQIIVGAGTEYLIGLIVQLLGRDGPYGVEDPGYPKVERLLESYQLPVKPIGLDDQGIRLDLLDASDCNVIHITPSHHFPLGIIMPVSRRLQLLDWASRVPNRYIIEDDYDSEFRFTGRPVPALLSLDKNGRVLYLGTFSKSIAPSIRIGYLVLPPQLLASYQRDLSFLASTVSRFEQTILARFIEAGHFDRHLNKMRKLYREKRDCLLRELDRWPFRDRIRVSGIENGLHLVLYVRSDATAQTLVERAQSVGIKLTGLEAITSTNDTVVVLLGYAHLSLDELKAAAVQLSQAWSPLMQEAN